jgi:hypothetical protein
VFDVVVMGRVLGVVVVPDKIGVVETILRLLFMLEFELFNCNKSFVLDEITGDELFEAFAVLYKINFCTDEFI